MGNANTHERRKSGVLETGMTIEIISEEPRVEEAALVTAKSEKKSEETQAPSFDTQASVTSDKAEEGEVGAFLKKIPTVYNFDEWTNGKNLPTVVNQHGSNNKVNICPKLFKFTKINRLSKKISPRKNKGVCIQQEEDIEAFLASLDMDSKATNVRHQRREETEFGQEIPGLDTFESSPGPPMLPPHLGLPQVILNKDTPLSCEPTSLPEPNHVMLNHLYAGVIQDGVLVISSTRRFRNKFATSIHYKPIEP